MRGNQVHPFEIASGEASCQNQAVGCSLPVKFCSAFKSKAICSNVALPGVMYELLPKDASATMRTVSAKILDVVKRHSRYQYLMGFRLYGSRLAVASRALLHLACILILTVILAVLYKEVTSRNIHSIGATPFCSIACQNAGVCSTFEALPNASAASPSNRCACLPGFYGDECETDLRSPAETKAGYAFSTVLFSKVYETALVYMMIITAGLCMQVFAFMRSIQSILHIHESIKRVQPSFGSIRYHQFASIVGSCDAYALPQLSASAKAWLTLLAGMDAVIIKNSLQQLIML
jgi:hypothetical protein